MKIQCPSCDQRLEIPDELPEQTIECPACNASLAVPSLATPPPSPVQVQQSAPQVTASEKPKSSIPKWVIASVAGIAVLVVCLIMFFPNDPNGVSSSEPTAVKTDGESQQATTAAETKPIERVPGAKAPDISIVDAAMRGNIEAVKQHIATGTDVNTKDNLEGTPLQHAAYSGHKEIAELLISEGGDVNAVGGYSKATPLHYAARNGHKEIAELLIGNGADVNVKDEKKGETPLGWASGYGRTEIIKLLIAKGADVNTKNNDGKTPIDLTDTTFFPGEAKPLLRKHGGKTAEELKAEGK